MLTQQCLEPMAADFPAMGPFPEVKLDSVPEIMKTEDLCNPVEVGKFELTEDKKKKLCTHDLVAASATACPAWRRRRSPACGAPRATAPTSAPFGAYFTLMGVELPPPPAP